MGGIEIQTTFKMPIDLHFVQINDHGITNNALELIVFSRNMAISTDTERYKKNS